ncbi:hypothetical protein L1887_53097 [Cichorium endivia]|nr:hypothetical protein L1887_53097 [Cichorium endivia]
MEAAIQAQLTQRAILTADMLPDSKGASQRRAAAWAASQLPLQNSSLASTALPLCLAGAGEHGSPAAASLLVRLSSSRALALALQVFQRCFPSASGNSLSLLQEVVSSDKTFHVPGLSLRQDLVNVGRVSQEFADRLAIDLRYDDNVLDLLQSHGLPPQMLVDLLLVALLHRQEARSVLESASSKRLNDLSILERSARLSSTATVHDEDQAATAVRNVYPLVVEISNTVVSSVQSQAAASCGSATLRRVALLMRSADYLQSLCTTSELDFSSIQILVRFMSNLVREINAGGLDVAAALTRTIDLLGGSLTLSSGKALSTIWSLYGADEGMQTNLYRLICDEAQLFRSAPSGDLLKSALDIATTLCVAGKQSASPSELRDMMQLGWQTLKMIRSASNKITAEGQDPNARSRASENAEATLLSMAELSIKTPECLSDPTNASRMKLVIALLGVSPFSVCPGCRCIQQGSVVVSCARIRKVECSAQRLQLDQASLSEKSRHDVAVGRMIQTAGAVLPASSPSRAEKLARILVRFVCFVSETLCRAALKDSADLKSPVLTGLLTVSDCQSALTYVLASPGCAPHSGHCRRFDGMDLIPTELLPLRDRRLGRGSQYGAAWTRMDCRLSHHAASILA